MHREIRKMQYTIVSETVFSLVSGSFEMSRLGPNGGPLSSLMVGSVVPGFCGLGDTEAEGGTTGPFGGGDRTSSAFLSLPSTANFDNSHEEPFT